MADLLTILIGVAIVLGVGWEVFQDLFHPTESGALSGWIGRKLFRLCRGHPTLLPLAGPIAQILVIATWVLLLSLGFALVYAPGFPEQFRTSTGAIPQETSLLTAFYVSFESLITLGYGDLVPHSAAMRLLAGLEGVIGFGVLTASVTVLVLIYPALSRMRLLARTVAHVVDAERQYGVSLADSGSEVILAGLARDVVTARIDLMHFPLIYYFRSPEDDASVAHWTEQLSRLARDGLSSAAPPRVRIAASTLNRALDDLAEVLARRFVEADASDRQAVFRAFADDQQVGLA